MSPCGIHEFDTSVRVCPICAAVNAEVAQEAAADAKLRHSKGGRRSKLGDPPKPTNEQKRRMFPRKKRKAA